MRDVTRKSSLNYVYSDVISLCVLMICLQTLRELKLSFNQIGSEGMKAIASGLKQNTVIFIDRNKYVHFLYLIQSLTTLIIRKSDIGPSAEFCFRDLFKENQVIQS